LEEGGDGFVEVVVGNRQDATAEGDFNAYIDECSDGFSSDGGNFEASPAPGETNTVRLGVSGNYEGEEAEFEGSCTVRVDYNRDVDASVTENVDLTLKQSLKCDANKESASVNEQGNWEIFKCNSEGTELNFQKECASGKKAKEVSPGDYQCQSKSGGQDEEVCGDEIDNDNDGKTDEGCEGGGGEVTRWIANSDETECISNTYPEDTIPDPSFNTKDSCQKFYGFSDSCQRTLLSTSMGDVKYNDPFCGEQSFISKVANVLHMFFALVIGLIVGYIFYYSGRWIDGERSIRGSFKLSSRSVSRFKKGSAAIGAIVGLIGLLLGMALGLSIPLWMELLFLGLMIVLAWVLDKYLGFITIFTA
jgi:hypothetical protein